MRFPSRPILYASGFNAESRQAAIVAYWYRKKSPDSVRNAAREEDSFISAKWGLFAISQASCYRAASRDTKSNGSNRFFGRARRRSAIGQLEPISSRTAVGLFGTVKLGLGRCFGLFGSNINRIPIDEKEPNPL